MALRNPVFNNDAFSQDPRAVATYPGAQSAPTYGTSTQPPQFGQQPFGQQTYGQAQGQNAQQNAQWASAQQAAQQAAFQSQMEGMYASPAAGSLDTGRMTVEDTVMKTVGLFAILLVTAVVGWVWTLGGNFDPRVAAHNETFTMVPWIVGALGAFVLAMVITFTARKKVRPALIFGYAALEGLFIGGVSAFFEAIYPGIVLQATLATFAVVGVVLALFASGRVRASKKVTKIFMVAMISYLVFSLINIGLVFFNVLPPDLAFGLRDVKIFGIPLGVVIGIVVILMASYSLVLDFDGIQQGVKNGAPREMGWMGAFGIMVTVVWLYIEILRLIAILRGND